MKKLWEVDGKYFDKKMDAKAYRDANGGNVHKGVDHADFGVKHGNSIHPKKSGGKKIIGKYGK